MQIKTTKPLTVRIGTKRVSILPHHRPVVNDRIGKQLLARSPHVRRVKN